ncbi:olfactory receptor 1019-like [Rhinatrema bivittatum]|uniref:olfactory receptor 1019-like n=1 Tax=Rhinatrema bivittatum TaxID=194408 RepID=UPI00112D178A|nr:olfactory receptor 1019-like [Rhinatrema bivittatum]XP_029442447.1 olfactory receptor 1019-like [Rhinatrema bivittatum]
MGRVNQSTVSEFLILGFSDDAGLQFLPFCALLMLYSITLMGNLLILTVVAIDPQLHSPMYFFLTNLSSLDICYTTATIPKMLTLFLAKRKTVSVPECMAQLYFFMSFTSTEFFLLTAMAYDRYAAICDPLHYSLVMNKGACILLAASSWLTGCLASLPHIVLTSRLSFCHSNVINHIFCDLMPLLKLSCSDTSPVEIATFMAGGLLGVTSFLLTLASYVYIITTILRIHSMERRRKAFSTCSSHLTVVVLFYTTNMCMYMRPASMYSLDLSKVFSLLYISVIPMLNPIIYSLRNQDVKTALRKITGRTLFFLRGGGQSRPGVTVTLNK